MAAKKPILLIICMLFLLIHFTKASTKYYADVSIIVENEGYVEIKGTSNHHLLQPGRYDNLTSKKDGFWMLNISTTDIFEYYKYSLELPKNSKVNYLGVYAIDNLEDNNGLQIFGYTEDKPFGMIIQYKKILLNDPKIQIGTIITILIILFVSGIVYLKFRTKKNGSNRYEREKYSEREYEIIELLIKNGGNMSQAELQKKTLFPKASLHRNIKSLELKDIVEKHRTGMSNKIVIKEKRNS